MKNKTKWTTKAKCLRNMMQGAIARGDLSRVAELKTKLEIELGALSTSSKEV